MNDVHDLPDFASSPPQGGGSKTKNGRPWHLLCRWAHKNRMVLKYDLIESLVVYVFLLHLKARDHRKFNFIFPWYGLLMSFKGRHNFMSMALGHSVKWSYLSHSTTDEYTSVKKEDIKWFRVNTTLWIELSNGRFRNSLCRCPICFRKDLQTGNHLFSHRHCHQDSPTSDFPTQPCLSGEAHQCLAKDDYHSLVSFPSTTPDNLHNYNRLTLPSQMDFTNEVMDARSPAAGCSRLPTNRATVVVR